MRWKGIKGDCWSRFIHLQYDDVINKCRSCIMGNWHYQQPKWPLDREISYCSLDGLINCVSEHLGTSQEDFHEEFSAVLPLKPGLSGRGNFGVLPLIPLNRVLERDYFRKCERAKFDIWFPYSGILNCDVNEFETGLSSIFPFQNVTQLNDRD